jgi:CHAT domain-containing protein
MDRASAALALVEYYVLPGEAAAFVVRPDRDQPIVERLDIDRATIGSAALRLVDEMSPEQINPVHPEWSSDLECLEPLSRALLDPVWPHVEDVEAVCIVPHGHLFYLPFHALRLASGRYLIEDKPIAYAPSAALMMLARRHRRTARANRFVGFGTGKAGDPPARRQGFEDEVRAISALALFAQQQALTGDAASATAFLAAAEHADVVHCACHGHFDTDDPFGSGLLLAEGLLSARTIAAATINADLVYLSACVSGRHDIRPGDELLGLVRAFIRAGTASIVASLWPIAAWSSTRLLMETFYARWLVDGMPKIRAMQAAQLETMSRHPHPYHWAPFALLGDWH